MTALETTHFRLTGLMLILLSMNSVVMPSPKKRVTMTWSPLKKAAPLSSLRVSRKLLQPHTSSVSLILAMSDSRRER